MILRDRCHSHLPFVRDLGRRSPVAVDDVGDNVARGSGQSQHSGLPAKGDSGRRRPLLILCGRTVLDGETKSAREAT